MDSTEDLVIGDLITVNDDLLGPKRPLIEKTGGGPALLLHVELVNTEMKGLPRELQGMPLAELLDAADARYDGWARASYKLADAMREIPDAATEVLDTADLVQTVFVPGLDTTRKAYSVESNHAQSVEGDLAKHRSRLDRVPTPDGKSLAVWLDGMVTAGKQIGTLAFEVR